MSTGTPEYAQRAIADACAVVDRKLAELAEAKATVNGMCRMWSMQPVYPDTAPVERTNFTGGGRPDRYFNKPLATVVRTVLSTRHDANIGPASVEELYDEMLSGGFDFENKSEENSKRALAVSLAKNNAVFRKLKNGTWGLVEWYGGVKPSRSKSKAVAEPVGVSPENTAAGQDDPFAGIFDGIDDDVESEQAEPVNKPR